MIRTLTGDCRAVLPTLAAASVQCCVTSPPYFGLRNYGTATWRGGDPACDHGGNVSGGPKQTPGVGMNGHASAADRLSRQQCAKCGAIRVDQQIGAEPTPDTYIAELVAVFREVRRVLRDDGTVWLNLGDSYCSTDKWGGGVGGNTGKHTIADDGAVPSWSVRQRKAPMDGIKPKDLMMIPARVALALQADGWWLRSDIIWAKPNPMPESVTDRPTSAHEHVFLLAKSPRYFFDAVAIAEEAVSDHDSGNGYDRAERLSVGGRGQKLPWTKGANPTRNARNVWTITSSPYPEAHFAVFPAELAERCIKAGTSEHGACATCRSPFVRQIKTERSFESGSGQADNMPVGKNGAGLQGGGETLDIRRGPTLHTTTTGWQKSCACQILKPVPCVVLDPFSGAGTTMLVADRLRRDAVGIELSRDYVALAQNRIVDDAPLFAQVAAQ